MDMVCACTESEHIPIAVTGVISDGALDSPPRFVGESDRGGFELTGFEPTEGGIRADVGCAVRIRRSICGASIVSVEPGSVCGPGQEIGQRGSHACIVRVVDG